MQHQQQDRVQLRTRRNRYFAYCRVSSLRQTEGASLFEQRSAIERYAHSRNLTVSERFEETETAAKRGKRLQRSSAPWVMAINEHVRPPLARYALNREDIAMHTGPSDTPLSVELFDGEVVMRALDGPLSVSLTARAAAETAERLKEAAARATQLHASQTDSVRD